MIPGIQVWPGALDNSKRLALSDCKSSSSHRGYPCRGAVDGKYGSRPGIEWASDKQGTQAWIMINLTKPSGVVRMKITNRNYGGGDEVKKAIIQFDNGAKRKVRRNTLKEDKSIILKRMIYCILLNIYQFFCILLDRHIFPFPRPT